MIWPLREHVVFACSFLVYDKSKFERKIHKRPKNGPPPLPLGTSYALQYATVHQKLSNEKLWQFFAMILAETGFRVSPETRVLYTNELSRAG